MVITLCGDNTYEVQHAMAVLIKSFTKKHGANAIERLDGVTVSLGHLREQVSALSLFASKRLVILKDVSRNKELFSELEALIPQVQDEVTLVVVDGALDKRTRTYKVLKAQTDFREFAALSESQLLRWISDQVKNRGGEIAAADATLLLEYAGGDQWRLAGEIEKLLAFGPRIAAADIKKVVVPSLEASAFNLLDAALNGRVAETQRLLAILRTQSDPYEFFGLLVWQANALAIAAVAPRMSSADLAKRSGLKPFVLQKSQGLAVRLGEAKVRRIVDILANLDMQLKSTGVEPWALVGQALDKIVL